MKDKENQNISMKEMLTKRSFEPITNCNCKIESRIDYAVRNENKERTFTDLLNQEIKELHEEKSKQIEEMAKAMQKCYERNGLLNFKWFAESAYKCLTKDSVVLTREEYEKLKNESIDKLFADDTFFKEEFKANKEYLRKRANRDYIKLVKKQSSKETAEKIFKDLKLLVPDNALGIVTRYFKEILNVEIKE